VDVTVPILTIQEGGITVPVSLAYQSSGLRVEEKPSWVGMGWILNAGGVITRTMRGRCDDLSKGFLSNANSIPDYSVVTGDLGNTTFRTDVYEFLGGVVDNQIDYVPDAFSFNFQGHGGSFTLSLFGILKHHLQTTPS
jgi:hypothetical protein